MSAQNGVGCLLMLLLHPNGHAPTTHGTQKGNAILCSLLMRWAMCDPINLFSLRILKLWCDDLIGVEQ
jgi:hypothetical protein